jgi:hypothetical protein
MARTMLRVLKHARIPLFLYRKSNHVFTVWQHIVLLTMRQYEAKSYRMFAEWLVEAHYLRTFLQLSRIPYFTAMQKFAARISGTVLEKIIASFILLTDIKQIFILRTGRVRVQANPRVPVLHHKGKVENGLGQAVYWRRDARAGYMCNQNRRGPGRHDNIDFEPLVEKAAAILPLSVVTPDKGYDDEDNHVLVRERHRVYSIIYRRGTRTFLYGRRMAGTGNR